MVQKKTWYYLANVDSGNTTGILKVHVDKKLDNNNVQLQTIYSMDTMLFNEFGDRNVWRHGEFKDFQGPM